MLKEKHNSNGKASASCLPKEESTESRLEKAQAFTTDICAMDSVF